MYVYLGWLFLLTDICECEPIELFLVPAFTHGAMGRRIDPLWGGPIELFLVPASAPRLV